MSADLSDTQDRLAAITAEFDAWAPSYESGRLAPWYQMHARTAFEHLDLTGARRVLDIGCGTGWALRQLARAWPGIEFHGLDLSPAMVAEARHLAALEGLDNLTFHQGDWEHFGPRLSRGELDRLAPGFDAVLLFSSFHYFANPLAALETVHEVLYNTGKVVIIERDSEGSILTRMWGALHKHLLKDGVRFAGTGELLSMMREAGFADTTTLAEIRQLLRHGKLYTAIVIVGGTKRDAFP